MTNITVTPASEAEIITTPSKRVLRRIPYNPHFAAYQSSDLLVVIMSNDTEGHGTLFHLSISRKTKLPNWTEMLDVWSAVRQDSPMMILPTWTKHKSFHDNCLHFYSVPDDWKWYVEDRIQHASMGRPYTDFGPIRRSGINDQRPSYTNIVKARERWFSISDDVIVFFDLHHRSYRSSVFLMKTPEPWNAGGAV